MSDSASIAADKRRNARTKRAALAAACAVALIAALVPSVFSKARAAGPVLPDFGPGTRWVSYGHARPQPTAVTLGDMTLLKQYGATGIITYNTLPGWADDATIASSLGMKVILGIDNPTDGAEDIAAVALAKALAPSIQGIVVGNEGLCWSQYSYGDLVSEMDWLRQQLGDSVPLSTAEPLQVFEAAYYHSTEYEPNCNPGIFPGLLSLGDFVSVNLAPLGCDAVGTAHWWSNRLSWLSSITGKMVTGHEVYQATGSGLPGLQANQWCSQTQQRDLFCILRSYTNSFSHFTGFDEPGADVVMANGGLFTVGRAPKLAAQALTAC